MELMQATAQLDQQIWSESVRSILLLAGGFLLLVHIGYTMFSRK